MEASTETLILKDDIQLRTYHQFKRQGPGQKIEAPSLSSDHAKQPWRTGFFRRFPFLGIIPLLISLLCECSVRTSADQKMTFY